MKQYIKPTVEVVNLSVKETIAELPSALITVDTNATVNNQSVILTTYNLAAQSTSANV